MHKWPDLVLRNHHERYKVGDPLSLFLNYNLPGPKRRSASSPPPGPLSLATPTPLGWGWVLVIIILIVLFLFVIFIILKTRCPSEILFFYFLIALQVWTLTQFFSVSFLSKIIDSPGDPSSGKHYFLPFLPATPKFSSRTLGGLFERTRRPSQALNSPRALLPELQRYKDTF